MAGDVWTFIGTVESINVKGDKSAASHQCLFALKSANGTKRSFLLDPFTVPNRYAAQLQVLCAAAASLGTLKINATARNAKEPPIAWELELWPTQKAKRR